MIKVYGYSKCSTVKKSLNYLEAKGLQYQHIDNVQDKLTASELKELYQKSDLDLKKFFNTSGMKYRELDIKNKFPFMSEEDCFDLLASDGMLVKRPILVTDKGISVGFKEANWEKLI